MSGKDSILITGGSGFLGSRVSQLLLKKYPKTNIILTDIVESSRLDSLKEKVEFVKGEAYYFGTFLGLSMFNRDEGAGKVIAIPDKFRQVFNIHTGKRVTVKDGAVKVTVNREDVAVLHLS